MEVYASDSLSQEISVSEDQGIRIPNQKSIKQHVMERDEFLKTLGISFALACTGTCFQACSKSGDDDDTGTPNSGSNTVNVDISTMGSVGSQTTVNGVLFFRIASENTASSFVATESACPHQGNPLTWQQNNNRIFCSLHSSTYTSAGAVTNQPVGGGSTRALKIYSVTLAGTTLTATKT